MRIRHETEEEKLFSLLIHTIEYKVENAFSEPSEFLGEHQLCSCDLEEKGVPSHPFQPHKTSGGMALHHSKNGFWEKLMNRVCHGFFI